MYTQFFGSYLLQNNAITKEQLMSAIAKLSDNRIKIGTIALTKGLMTASEIDECLFVQTRENKRFGEIAIERGYLSEEQVKDLLDEQVSDYVLLGQILVEDGCFSNSNLERLMFDYQQENELYDLDLDAENSEKVRTLIDRFFITAEIPSNHRISMYMELLFNSLIRFIGDDFTPCPPMVLTEYPVSFAISQDITGKSTYTTTIDLDRNSAVEFAGRYANDFFDNFNEYVMASIEDFINLHNGLFVVNISNSESDELILSPPHIVEEELLPSKGTILLIPVLYPFGKVNLLVSF